MKSLAVLGGSSPYCAGLVDALVNRAHRLQPRGMVLFGRNRANLEVLRRHANTCLAPAGWSVTATTDLQEAVAGAGVVIHQIRYGGMEGRRANEELSRQFDLPADETLGPAALASLLETLRPLQRISTVLARECPDAWVLNLTNPLSACTSVMVEAGVQRCVGLCELPLTTAEAAAAILEIEPEQLDWEYAGLNHRGFITRLRQEYADQMDRLVTRLGSGRIGGIDGPTIAALGALPTKYFALVLGRQAAKGDRGAFLQRLGREILAELRPRPNQAPAALQKRDLAWYGRSVVPMIEALESREPRREVVNVVGPDGMTREQHADVSAEGLRPRQPQPPPEPAARWLQNFERHERAVLEVARKPCEEAVLRALCEDPTVPSGRVSEVGRAISNRTHVEEEMIS